MPITNQCTANIFRYLFILVNIFTSIVAEDLEFCSIEDTNCNGDANNSFRYLFYDVNPPEGFNLRRDVYMRYAIFAHNWKKMEGLDDFKLVLPPWSQLYHWKHRDKPEYIPWGLYFDIESLKRFAPVIEMHEFFEESGIRYPPVKIKEVYILQHYSDMFETGNFEDRMSIEKCDNTISTAFFFYKNITSDNIRCLSFHGHASQLSEVLLKSKADTIMFDHAEVALHDRFGDISYWEARRSMRFNKDLIKIASEYRAKFLNSSDELDNTVLPEKWENEKPKRDAKGGPYLGVHLRRRDFVYGRRKQIPSLEEAAKQIRKLLKKLKLNAVFIASDAPDREFEELEILIKNNEVENYNVFKFKPNTSIRSKYKDGGVAIIDQIICSYASYFVGSYESTFSFRIQEEREILGFPWETTFNRLCGDKEEDCQRPSIWKILY